MGHKRSVGPREFLLGRMVNCPLALIQVILVQKLDCKGVCQSRLLYLLHGPTSLSKHITLRYYTSIVVSILDYTTIVVAY